MQFKILAYDENQRCHRCLTPEGKKMLVDIMVDGGFEDTEPGELVGKSVICDYTLPYISIAHNVQLAHEEG